MTTQINASPDGSKLIYAQGKNIVIRDTANPGLCEIYSEHKANTTVAKFSRNGHWIASADTTGKVRVWAWSNPLHQLKVEVPVFAGEVADLDWGSENKRICAVGRGRSQMCKAFMWDTGNSVGNMAGHNEKALSVSMKPGRPYRIVTGGEDMISIHWKGPPFKYDHKNQEHKNFVNCVRYSPDGNVYATVSSDRSIFLYSGKEGEFKGAMNEAGAGDGHDGAIYACAWSADSTRLLTASADKTVKLWDVETSAVITTFNFSDAPGVPDMQTGVVWADPTIASISLSGDINFLDPNSGSKPINVVNGHMGAVSALAYDRDSGSLISGDTAGVTNVWKDDTARRLGGSPHTSNVRGAISSGGRFTTIGWDNTARFGSTEGDFEAQVALPAQPRGIASAVGENSLAAVVTRYSVSMVREGAIASSQETQFECKSVAVSPDGTQVAVGAADYKIHLFPLAGDVIGEETAVLEGHFGPITCLAYSPDGAYIAAGDTQMEVKLWDLAASSIKIQGRWNLHGTTISCLAFSPSGNYVASGSMDNHIFIWNVNNEAAKLKLPFAHKDGVEALAFKEDNVLVSSGKDSCIRTWNLVLPQ